MNRLAGLVGVFVLFACSSPVGLNGRASDSRSAAASPGHPAILSSLPGDWTYAGLAAQRDGRLVLVAAAAGWQGEPLVTLEWDGAHWWNMNTPGPVAGLHPAMAFDPISSRVILFGGDELGSQRDTWAWDGAIWKLLKPIHVPPGLGGSVLTYDSARARLVLVGASFDTSSSGGVVFTKEQTWAWLGSDWKDATPSITPPARYQAVIGSDLVRRTVILQGGQNGAGAYVNDTWSWDGSAWTKIPTDDAPLYRQTTVAAGFDPISRRLLAFLEWDETWLWDGVRWLLQTQEPTPSDYEALIAADPLRGRLVALTGGGGAATLWSWDGARWMLLEPLSLATWRTYTSPFGYAIDYPPYWYLTDSPEGNPNFYNRNGVSPEAGNARDAWMGISIYPGACSKSPWTVQGHAGSPGSLGGMPGTLVNVRGGVGVQANHDGRCYFLFMTGAADAAAQAGLTRLFEEVSARFRFVPATASAARTQ